MGNLIKLIKSGILTNVNTILKMCFMRGFGIRKIHRTAGVHRDTISKYLPLDEPQPQGTNSSKRGTTRFWNYISI